MPKKIQCSCLRRKYDGDLAECENCGNHICSDCAISCGGCESADVCNRCSACKECLNIYKNMRPIMAKKEEEEKEKEKAKLYRSTPKGELVKKRKSEIASLD